MSDKVVNSHEMECTDCGKRVIWLVWSNGEIEWHCSYCGSYSKMTLSDMSLEHSIRRRKIEEEDE